MTVLVQFSTGAGSAEVAVRCIEQHGLDGVHLLSADTAIEDEDNWRFAEEVWEWLGRPVWHRLRDGRTPMEVGRDVRVVPNNRMAVCSRILKREPLRNFMDEHYDPATDVVALGFDWTEDHRLRASIEPWKPWTVVAPLMEAPFLQKADILGAWRSRGIEPPRLYEHGFSHANCGGGCVRGGQAQWAHLLKTFPERYAYWEDEEEKTRQFLGKDVTILRDRRGGTTKTLSLRDFRLRLAEERPDAYDPDDWGACGCFTQEEDGTSQVGVTIT